MQKEIFTTFDIVKGFGLRLERLRQWIKWGYIKPSIRVAKGIGTKNLFSRWDLYIIYLFKMLIDKRGFKREAAAEVVQGIDSKWFEVYRRFGKNLDNELKFIMISWWPLDDGTDEVVMVVHTPFVGDPIKELPTIIQSEQLQDIQIINFQRIREDVDKLF